MTLHDGIRVVYMHGYCAVWFQCLDIDSVQKRSQGLAAIMVICNKMHFLILENVYFPFDVVFPFQPDVAL